MGIASTNRPAAKKAVSKLRKAVVSSGIAVDPRSKPKSAADSKMVNAEKKLGAIGISSDAIVATESSNKRASLKKRVNQSEVARGGKPVKEKSSYSAQTKARQEARASVARYDAAAKKSRKK